MQLPRFARNVLIHPLHFYVTHKLRLAITKGKRLGENVHTLKLMATMQYICKFYSLNYCIHISYSSLIINCNYI